MLKFKIERSILFKLLKVVSGSIERKSPITPILSNVLIDVYKGNICLTGSDGDLEVKVKHVLQTIKAENGKVAIPFRKLFDICKVLVDGVDLTISEFAHKVEIIAGRSRFIINSSNHITFPEFEYNNQFFTAEINSSQLKKSLEKVSFCMGDQDVRNYLNGIFFGFQGKKLSCIASDGFRLAFDSCEVMSSSDNANSVNFILPKKSALELQKLLNSSEDFPVKIGLSDLAVRFVLGETEFTSKLIEDDFPNYKNVVPEVLDKKMLADRLMLKEAFTRASAVFTDRVRGITLSLREGLLKIRANTPDQDIVEEDVEIQYHGQDLDVSFNAKFLIESLANLHSPIVALSFYDENSAVYINGVEEDNLFYVVMPLRI